MKKIFFPVIAMTAFFLLTTCDLFDSGHDIVPPEDNSQGSYGFTVYLDDNVPPASQSRALNFQLARSGHDYFEVVFKGPNGRVARASWEIGQSSTISGVERDDHGVDYSEVDPNEINPAAVPHPKGAAVIFIGNKQDRTLLAVGRLVMVDGVTGTVITSESRSITFEVDTLKAGVSTDRVLSSFKTAAGDPGNPPTVPPYRIVSSENTLVSRRFIGHEAFPLYRLEPGAPLINAEYTFGLNVGDFSYYNPAMILAGGRILERRRPTFTTNNGNLFANLGALDTETRMDIINNTRDDVNPSANVAFENPVKFTFNTTTTNLDTVFSFVFAVPIFALSHEENPVMWFLRPGYGAFMRDLDSGHDRNGAIFAGNSRDLIDVPHDFWLSIDTAPRFAGDPPVEQKFKDTYNHPDGMIFELNNFFAYLHANTGAPQNVPTNATGVRFRISPNFGDQNTPINISPVTVLPSGELQGGVLITPGQDLATTFNGSTWPQLKGFQAIYMEYQVPLTHVFEGARGRWFHATFYIFVGPSGASLNIDYRLVGRWDELNTAIGAFAGAPSGTMMVLVVMHNRLQFNQRLNIHGTDKTLVIVAGVPDLILGRNGENSGFHIYGLVEFYLGIWPFADQLMIALPYTTYPFEINYGGSADDLSDNSVVSTWITYETSTPAAHAIVHDAAVTVHHTAKRQP